MKKIKKKKKIIAPLHKLLIIVNILVYILWGVYMCTHACECI